MDLSDKRFHDLEELIKTRNSFHEWIREGKEQTQLFNQQVEKTSVPFLANVIKKEDEIIDKLKQPLPKPTTEVAPIDYGLLPPEYEDLYSDFGSMTIKFKTNFKNQPKLEPKHVQVDQYNHRFSAIDINGARFIFYSLNGKDIIQPKDQPTKQFPLTEGLIILMEIRGLLILAKRKVYKDDIDNYLEIMKIAGIKTEDNEYLQALANGEMGTGKKIGKGIDDTLDEDNPLELFTELRKLLAAKVSGHNNVYNSVVSILKKLMNMGEITEDKYDKILHKYF